MYEQKPLGGGYRHAIVWRSHWRTQRKARRSALDGAEIDWVRLPARRHDPRHPRGFLVGSSQERPRFRAYLGVERTLSPDGATESVHGFIEVLSGVSRLLRDEVEEDLSARGDLPHGLLPLVLDAWGRLLHSFENFEECFFI